MALLKNSSKSINLENGDNLQEAAKQLGVAFGCRKGVCGACVVEVLDGMDNLSAKAVPESDFDMRDNDRMMCQCTISSGDVTIR